MNMGTHIAFASTLYLGGAMFFSYQPDWVGWTLAATASLGPDIDLPTSRIGRWMFFASVPLERRFGHRTITHSTLGVAAVALLALPLWLINPLYFWCVVLGYWSHLWIDMVNIRGIDLFWPSPIRVVMPGRRKWRIEVGSKAEMVLLAALIALAVALYPLSKLGFRDSLQLILRNFDIAREQFQRAAGTHWYKLDLEATDNLTLEQVMCECPVLGAWQKGLIVVYQGKPRAVGESQVYHDLFPVQARLIEGPALHVVSEKVDMRGRSLRWLLSRIDQGRAYYLLGALKVSGSKIEPLEDIQLYRPVVYRGHVLILHYAREQELGPWLDLVASEGELYVQFWLRPGDPPVAFDLGEDKPVDRIPDQLREFL